MDPDAEHGISEDVIVTILFTVWIVAFVIQLTWTRMGPVPEVTGATGALLVRYIAQRLELG